MSLNAKCPRCGYDLNRKWIDTKYVKQMLDLRPHFGGRCRRSTAGATLVINVQKKGINTANSTTNTKKIIIILIILFFMISGLLNLPSPFFPRTTSYI